MKDFVFSLADVQDGLETDLRLRFRKLKKRGHSRKMAEAIRKLGFDPALQPNVDALTYATGNRKAAVALAAAFQTRSPEFAAPRIIGALGPDNALTGPIVAGVATVLTRGGLSPEDIARVFAHMSYGKLLVSVGALPAGSDPEVATEGGTTSVALPPPPSEGGDADDGSASNPKDGDDTTGETTGGPDDENTGTPEPEPNPTPEPEPNPNPPSGKGFWGLLNAILTGAAKGAAVGAAGGALAGVGTGPGAATTTAYGGGLGVVVGGTIGGGAYIFGGVMALPDGSGDLVWY